MAKMIFKQRTPLASGIPLGGMGTGSVELMDTGRFRDWELFNNYQWSGHRDEKPPEMWSEDAFFAVRTKSAQDEARVRLLHLEDDPTKTVSPSHDQALIYNFPFVRHVAGIEFEGRHPFARLRFEDETLPVDLELEAFSPFIPHQAKDSGLPLAFFVFKARNPGTSPCEVSLMFSLRNCAGYDHERIHLRHRVEEATDARWVVMDAEGIDPRHRTAGSMVIGVGGSHDELSHEAAWTSGRGYAGAKGRDNPAYAQVFHGLRDEGRLGGTAKLWHRELELQHPEVEPGTLRSPEFRVGWCWRGAVARKLVLPPGEEREVTFVMAWHFPNHFHYKYRDKRIGHSYENDFADARAVADYGWRHFEHLRRESRAFVDGLFSGTLPEWMAASLNAQLTTFPKSFMWAADGDMAVWEGQSCGQLLPGGRTIWSSWVPVMFFPDVYRDAIRRMTSIQIQPDGLPEGDSLITLHWRRRLEQTGERTDRFGGWFKDRYEKLGYSREDFVRGEGTARRRRGIWGGAVELLRDYQWTGDRTLLEEVWPIVREGLESQVATDANGDGLPDGAISFSTYDHWFLPATHSYRCTMWLGELQAAVRLARILGATAVAESFASVLTKGRDSFEKLFWNGEYYHLCYDPLLDRNDPGCMSDQVSGHLFARVLGLGPIHDEERVRVALRAVRVHNLKEEEGLLNGTDPEGREDWRYFCRYSDCGEDETCGGQWPTPWTGTEYYVAAVMAAEGLFDEAYAVVKNVYDRHVRAGMVYNHIECGEHYFRALAVWAVLPALQGLVFERNEGRLRYAPRTGEAPFDSLFLLPGAWGRLIQTREPGRQENAVRVESGELRLRRLEVEAPGTVQSVVVSVGENALAVSWEQRDGMVAIGWPEEIVLTAGRELRVQITRS